MKILLTGAAGKMGKEISNYAESIGVEIIPFIRGDSLCAADANCIIDFSSRTLTAELMEYAVKMRMPVVIGTTGQTAEDMQIINDASKYIPIFISPNCSYGIAMLMSFTEKVSRLMPSADVAIVETHANTKKDKPSGTAIMLKDLLENYGFTPSVLSLRLADRQSTHKIIFATENESITLNHEANNKQIFAKGALKAAEYLLSLSRGSCGLYGMKNLSEEIG